MVPNFILGGAMKSGTTFLHSLLQNHPQIRIIDRNMDFSYFDDDRIFERGKKWYLKLFCDITADLKKGEIIGQTSADCNFNPGSVQRILAHNPDTKLIFILRHPIDRAYSLYWHQYGMGREFRRFESAIKIEPYLIKKSYYNFKHYSYLERSRYDTQFKEIVKIVPAENLLILDFESLVSETKSTINIVLEFLGLEKVNDLEELDFNNLPRNRAKIPTLHIIVIISYFFQRIGFVSFGRRIVNLFKKEVRPPKIKEHTNNILKEKLNDDILFYTKIRQEFNKRINQEKTHYKNLEH